MRYQDRLLRLGPTDRAALGQFIAREMEGLTLYFDSDSVLTALAGVAAERSDLAGVQAELALRRLEPVQQRRDYAPLAGPVQSRLMDEGDLGLLSPSAGGAALPAGGRAAAANAETMRRAAALLLEPIVEPLLALAARESGPLRRRALHVLGWLPHRRAQKALAEMAASESDADAPMAALLAAGQSGSAGASDVLAAVRGRAGRPELPAMLLSLGAAPSAEALRFLGVIASAGPSEALPAVAAAAEGFGAEDAEPLLERLCRDGHGWATVHALESIGRLRSPRALETVLRTYRRLNHPTLRAAAVKVAGTLGGADARQFLAGVLSGSPEPSVAARALEGLVRFADPDGAFAPLFALHAASPASETAVPALLGLAFTDRARVAAHLRRWLLETDPAWRAEAAYCLGYIPGDISLALLGKLGRADPDDAVRRQAVRSLALHGLSAPPVGLLLDFLASNDSAVRGDSALLLGHPLLAEDRAVYAGLVKAYPAAADDREAIVILRAIGQLGSGLAREFLAARVTEETVPVRLAAAADGLDRCGGVTAGGAWKRLAAHESPLVRAVAARGAWHAGDESAPSALAGLLSAGDAEAAAAALAEAGKMAITAVCLTDIPRFASLTERMRHALHSRSYREFVAEEFSVHLSPDRLPAGFEPPAAAQAARPWDQADSAPLAADDMGPKLERAMAQSRRRRQTKQRAEVEGLDGRVRLLSAGRLVTLGAFAVAFLLLGGGLFRGAARVIATPTARGGGAAPPPIRAALLLLGLPGGATLQSGLAPPIRAFPGSGVRSGVTFRSGTAAAVLSAPEGKDRLRLLPGTTVTVDDVSWQRSTQTVKIGLSGLLGEALLEADGPHSEWRIQSGPSQAIVYRGAVLLKAANGALTVQVASGRAEVGSKTASGVTVATVGQEVEVVAGKPGTAINCDPETVLREGRK